MTPIYYGTTTMSKHTDLVAVTDESPFVYETQEGLFRVIMRAISTYYALGDYLTPHAAMSGMKAFMMGRGLTEQEMKTVTVQNLVQEAA